jgi:hypothetical protein
MSGLTGKPWTRKSFPGRRSHRHCGLASGGTTCGDNYQFATVGGSKIRCEKRLTVSSLDLNPLLTALGRLAVK